jgi:hypothetical protein
MAAVAGDAMTNIILALTVTGTIAVALAVDLGALAVWLGERFR